MLIVVWSAGLDLVCWRRVTYSLLAWG